MEINVIPENVKTSQISKLLCLLAKFYTLLFGTVSSSSATKLIILENTTNWITQNPPRELS